MKYFNILEEKSGKTTQALLQYYQDPENSVLVVFNLKRLMYIREVFAIDGLAITTAGLFTKFMLGNRKKKIIFDDYPYLKNTRQIYEFVNGYCIDSDIHIFSTPQKLWDKKIFDFVKRFKNTPGGGSNIHQAYKHYFSLSEINAYEVNQITELYYNFITDKDTEVKTQ